MFEQQVPTPIVEIESELFAKKNVKVFIKRDDLIDPKISGNKWRKLKYNLIEARDHGFDTLLTFGGAYSNHIAATAAAAHKYGFQSIGIIRGDELNSRSNPTLKKANEDGMRLIFISRKEYKNRDSNDWTRQLSEKHHAFIVPEGGSNRLAMKGIGEMMGEIDIAFDYMLCPVGTGGTLAGMVAALNPNQKAVGIAVLNGADYLQSMITDLLPGHTQNNWSVNHQFHFGGYARSNQQLMDFIQEFYEQHQIPLDPIYTGKMMFGIVKMIENNQYPVGSIIIAVHTGGLQGVEGFNHARHTTKR